MCSIWRKKNNKTLCLYDMLTLGHVCLTQLLSAMVSKLGNMDDPLPQESFQGVDEDEWVSLRMEAQEEHPNFFMMLDGGVTQMTGNVLRCSCTSCTCTRTKKHL